MNASDIYTVNTAINEIQPSSRTTLPSVELAKGYERKWDTSLLEDIVYTFSVVSVLEGLGEDVGDVKLLLENLVNEYMYLLHPLPYYPDLIKWHGEIKPRDKGAIIESLGEDELFEVLGKILIYKEEFDDGYIDNVGVEDVCTAFRKFVKASGVSEPKLGNDLRDRGYRCITATALLLSKIVFG